MIKAVVFDLDGTLVSFNIDYKTLRAEVRSLLMAEGVPASIFSLNDTVFEMLDKTEIYMRNNGRKDEDIREVYYKALRTIENYELEAAKTASLMPGVFETLKTLSEEGLKIGLYTVNSWKTASYILKKFNIEDFFKAVISREKVSRVKPYSEHLEAVLKTLDVKPDETLVVGDSTVDMKCARKLNAIAVGISTGVSTQRELMEAGANYIITSIIDLTILVKQLTRL
ncbi:MAG: HAD family hydrolase [Candidatus Bathyarchaeia archaeon]|nr:HAD family hydrolase [Candidatus Bathyarchaeota archaeon]